MNTTLLEDRAMGVALIPVEALTAAPTREVAR